MPTERPNKEAAAAVDRSFAVMVENTQYFFVSMVVQSVKPLPTIPSGMISVADKIVIGGGGGESKSGVPNQIVCMDCVRV
jgi:hypothetical protein